MRWRPNGDEDYWIEPRVDVPTMTIYETRVKQPIGFIHWNNKKVKKR